MSSDEIRIASSIKPAGNVTMKIGTHLWMHWLRIVAEHEHEAATARARGVALMASGEPLGETLAEETRASMVAVSGAAHAIDSLYGELKPLIVVPVAMSTAWKTNRTSRYSQVFETLKRGCHGGVRSNTWPLEFKFLFTNRDAAVHHRFENRPAAPHPDLPTAVSAEAAAYSAENAARAADLAFDVVLTMLRNPRSMGVIEWAGGMASADTIAAYRVRI
jgi:transcriptional regulator GlxA family with amidase domain